MKFSDLKHCPFCGSEEFYEKQYARGRITYRMRFDDEETDNSAMYDSLDISYSGRAYCDGCHKYLGNYMSDLIGKAAYQEYMNLEKCELYYVTDDTAAIYHEGTYDECEEWLRDPVHREIIKIGNLNVRVMSVKKWQRFFFQ